MWPECPVLEAAGEPRRRTKDSRTIEFQVEQWELVPRTAELYNPERNDDKVNKGH